MTVERLNVYSGPYLGNGVATSFPIDFHAASVEEVGAYLNGVDVDPAAFVVKLNDDGTGTATFFAAPVGTLLLYSDPLFDQTTNFEDQGPFYQAAVNEPIDRSAIRDLVLRDRTARSVMVPIGESGLSLPARAQRTGGKVLGFNALSGDFEVQGASAFKGDPGGTDYAPGTLAQLSTMTIRAPIDQVLLTGIDVRGDYGAGKSMVYDQAVNAAYVAAHPKSSFVDKSGRGFRLGRTPAVAIAETGAVRPNDYTGAATDDCSKAQWALDIGMGRFGGARHPVSLGGIDSVAVTATLSMSFTPSGSNQNQAPTLIDFGNVPLYIPDGVTLGTMLEYKHVSNGLLQNIAANGAGRCNVVLDTSWPTTGNAPAVVNKYSVIRLLGAGGGTTWNAQRNNDCWFDAITIDDRGPGHVAIDATASGGHMRMTELEVYSLLLLSGQSIIVTGITSGCKIVGLDYNKFVLGEGYHYAPPSGINVELVGSARMETARLMGHIENAYDYGTIIGGTGYCVSDPVIDGAHILSLLKANGGAPVGQNLIGADVKQFSKRDDMGSPIKLILHYRNGSFEGPMNYADTAHALISLENVVQHVGGQADILLDRQIIGSVRQQIIEPNEVKRSWRDADSDVVWIEGGRKADVAVASGVGFSIPARYLGPRGGEVLVTVIGGGPVGRFYFTRINDPAVAANYLSGKVWQAASGTDTFSIEALRTGEVKISHNLSGSKQFIYRVEGF